MSTLPSQQQPAGGHVPSANFAEAGVKVSQSMPTPPVGDAARDADEALEAEIQAASDDMVEAQGRYMAGGGFEAMGDRDRAMALFYALIKRRSPAQVERMRQLQAYRMAREPGAGGPLA